MNKLFFVPMVAILLTSCTLPGMKNTETPVTTTPPVTGTLTSTGTTPQAMTASVRYTLRDGSATGKVLDTNVEAVAKAEGLYDSGNTYPALDFTLGEHKVVPGFEEGVASMKVGEKKVIIVAPKDGYGEATTVQKAPKNSLAPMFTTTVDKSVFADTITQSISRSQLGAQGGSGLTVGQTLTGGQDVTAKVVKIEGDTVTLDIKNTQNPFYGKKIVVGENVEKEEIKFTIKAITETGVTLDIENKKSPFYGKEFKEGSVAQTPSGTMTIKSMSGDTIEIEAPNEHPLAGKTLYFEVELLSLTNEADAIVQKMQSAPTTPEVTKK